MSDHRRQPSRRSVSQDVFACFETSVGFFEHASGSLTVGAMLKQGHRVPLAPLGAEKVSAIDVDGTSQPIDRVKNRMDNIGTQRFSVPLAQCFGTNRLDLVRRLPNTPPEDVVLPARIDTDDGPHAMIVGHYRHHRCPNDIEYGQRRRMKQRTDFSTLRLAQSLEDSCGMRYRAGQYL